MKNLYFRIAMPGVFLLLILALCLAVPVLFKIVNLVYLWIALVTIGIPTVLAGILFYLLNKFLNFKVSALPLGIVLVVMTVPSIWLLIESWLHFNPDDGPALGYMGIFYIGSAPLWLPSLIFWSWWSTRNA